MDQLQTPTGYLLLGYVIMSLITMVVYGFDKLHAKQDRRRVPERTLHLLELCLGWPGALVAQQIFRHKRQKPSFYLVTWLIAALHATFWVMRLRS